MISLQRRFHVKNITRIAAVMLAAGALQALAQGYPNKPVHVIITFPPGTGTDIVARTVTQKLSEFWGQPVLAENRAGAGGSIGAALVAKAVPDGYTLMIDSNAHVVTPAIYAELPYDTLKDFVDIAPLAGGPNVLVAGPGSKAKSVAELIAEAKAKPGQINFASAGIGSGTHLNLEKFKLAAGIDVTHVPYKGTPEVVTDLLGKRVSYYFAPISPAIPLIRDGRLRALAVSSARRSDQLPEVPTVAESGLPGFEFILWFGLWGPAGMPADIVDKISKDVNRALTGADVRERLAKLGNDTMIMSPGEFSRLVRKELDDYARIVKAAGIKPQ
ncbi:MAG: tripartite tricarboxylate transporter substrate binding protein [Betaproteobacteria bacterium]|nr:MAG: tripartite tricarboxylate transporter substrate binding protein [Betaproteobacteria bacterium]